MKNHIIFVCNPCSLKDFFAAADQNLVKTAVVYSHFAEEKNRVFADIQRSRRKDSHGIAMISARHGHPQIVILTHGEM